MLPRPLRLPGAPKPSAMRATSFHGSRIAHPLPSNAPLFVRSSRKIHIVRAAAFDNLASAFEKALKSLTKDGRLTPETIKEPIREIRRALLEADVRFVLPRLKLSHPSAFPLRHTINIIENDRKYFLTLVFLAACRSYVGS